MKKLLEPVIVSYYASSDFKASASKRAGRKGPLFRKQEEGFGLHSGGSITFAHHLYLVGDDEDTSWDQRNTSFEHVRWSIKARQADFVVFNTGHHWHKLDPGFELYTAMVNRVLEHIATAHR